MADGGFIKLYRSMLKWEWYSDANTKSVFLHLLLTAQHEDILWRGIEIKRGQVVIGRKKLAKDLGLSERQIRTSITRLKSTSEIATCSTNKYTLVTVIKYEEYQSNKTKTTSKTTSKTPTSDQQTTTNKNIKNIKNIYICSDGREMTYEQVFDIMYKRYPCKINSDRATAYKNFTLHLKGEGGRKLLSANQMLNAVNKYIYECEQYSIELKYMKRVQTFFNKVIETYAGDDSG